MSNEKIEMRNEKREDVREPEQPPSDDVYAGIPSKLDEDIRQSQLDVLAKVEW